MTAAERWAVRYPRSLLTAASSLALAIAGCSSGDSTDTSPGLTFTSTVHDTTVAQGARLDWPYSVTWRNQPVDSVSIGAISPPLGISIDLNAGSQTTTGNSATGFFSIVVTADPGTYTLNFRAHGAANQSITIPLTIVVGPQD